MNRRTFIVAAAGTAAAATFTSNVIAADQRIRVNGGTRLYIKDSGGKGRPVILTHAWPLSADIWDLQAAALANAGYRVIAYDRRGFGRSDHPRQGYDFDSFADDLSGIVKALELKDAALVGYSMGGGEIVRYFSRHKGAGIAKAVFVGAAASYLLKTVDNPNGLDAAVFDGIKDGVRGDRRTYLGGLLKDVFFDVSKPATNAVTAATLARWLDVAMQADAGATLACVDAFSLTDFRRELSAVNVPTLVLHGTADIPVPIALGRATAAGIQDAKLIEYADVSHGLVITEAERVTHDLLGFLAT
jgi:pimeloyl-ACP methyl ester carboxylesterase